ncbi:MAG: cupin domain-containing protein [Burkholderiaceae bacterium]
MIIRKGTARTKSGGGDSTGLFETASFSDTAGIKQYGAYLQTLQPGTKSSTRHWHEKEDEFLFVVSGRVTIVENDGPHVLEPGDAACWPAGVPNAHHAINHTDEPCSYLMVGTRLTHDVCHYPDVGKTLYTEGEDWRVEDASGKVLKGGKVEPEW